MKVKIRKSDDFSQIIIRGDFEWSASTHRSRVLNVQL
jgi:hypothetical protein